MVKHKKAFTILETLIAVVISSVILLTLFFVYPLVTRILEQALVPRSNAVQILDTLSTHLCCGVNSAQTNDYPLCITTNSQLSFYYAVITDAPPHIVHCRLAVHLQSNNLYAYTTTQQEHHIWGPPITNLLACSVNVFRATAIYKQQAYAAWPQERKPSWPHTIRLELGSMASTNIWCCEVFLPRSAEFKKPNSD